ncbi:MAG: hypothetical protein GXW99_05325 [Clostridiales bacterium]|nr:hypothetical protein [Clostridiales bacterium]
MAKYKRIKILDVVRFMPPKRHSIPGQDFNIMSSEVMRWMLRSPIVWNYIWNNIKQSGAIVYDQDSGTWRGIDYEQNDD